MSLDKNLLKRLKGKSFKAVRVRALQELRLQAMAMTNGWARLGRNIDRHFSHARAQGYAFRGVIVDPSALEAVESSCNEGLIARETLQRHGARVQARDFSILSHPAPKQGDLPWSGDWRHGYVYPCHDFRGYNHHAARDVPYDVKYPWELSRLWFLLPLMQKALIEKDASLIEEVFATLADFAAKNPYGACVNWHPMEASMRGITLVMLLEMALLAKASPDKIGLLLKTIARHGEFLWRTIEYTDNRGNHYAANLVALLAMGAALEGDYAPARAWRRYAEENIAPEILAQFLQDGVNFEKSTGYHLLVAELFLLADIILEKRGVKMAEEPRRRLHKAALFAAASRRPDGKIPLIGDTDNARVFAFDLEDPRDPSPLISLAAVVFEASELKGALTNERISPVLPWLLGVEGVRKYLELPSTPFSGCRAFPKGGFAVVRDAGAYLFFDAGEVGQNGVGGHGHNDILSFELGFEGHALIVDPGCPTYTGDPRARKLFRSTAYHNGLVVDHREIAEIEGPFRIANHAVPHGFTCEEKAGVTTLTGGHRGYARLPSPVDHMREIVFDPGAKVFFCEDRLSLSAAHYIERYFHFAPGVRLQVSGGEVIATLHQHRFKIICDAFSAAEIMAGRVSESYGHTAEGQILRLSTQAKADVALFMRIEKI